VKFLPVDHAMAGQNSRAFPAVYQVIDGQFRHVWPKAIQSVPPTVILPRTSPWALPS
jgi:hypothetical protein